MDLVEDGAASAGGVMAKPALDGVGSCREVMEMHFIVGNASTVPSLKTYSGGGTVTAIAGEHTRDWL